MILLFRRMNSETHFCIKLLSCSPSIIFASDPGCYTTWFVTAVGSRANVLDKKKKKKGRWINIYSCIPEMWVFMWFWGKTRMVSQQYKSKLNMWRFYFWFCIYSSQCCKLKTENKSSALAANVWNDESKHVLSYVFSQ